MNCPFCGKEMRPGRIGSGDDVRWHDNADQEDFFARGIRLSGAFKPVEGFFCPDCRQIILPVPEKTEGVLDIVERKLSDAGDKIEAVQKEWEARRAQAKKEKKKKDFGSKDPWEL